MNDCHFITAFKCSHYSRFPFCSIFSFLLFSLSIFFFFDSFLYQCYSCWFRCFVHSHSLALCISKCCFSILYIHDCSSHKIRLRLFSDIAILYTSQYIYRQKCLGCWKLKDLFRCLRYCFTDDFCFFWSFPSFS